MRPIIYVLSLLLVASLAGAEEHEAKITLDQAPAKVQTAITDHANGATVKTIEREQRDGKTVYSVEYTGKDEHELTFATDGTLLPDDDADETKDGTKKADTAPAPAAKPAK